MAKSSGFTVKVKMNSTNKILKDHGLNKDGRVIRFITTRTDALMTPFIPRWFRRRISKT